MKIALLVIAVFLLAAWAKHVEREARRGRCRRQEILRRYLANEPVRDPDAMRVVEYHEVAPHVYEVTTESARYGWVKQRVLVLPED